MIELTREQCRANNLSHGNCISKRPDHKCPEYGQCMFCDGGLFQCDDCGAAEIECEEMSCKERQALNERLPEMNDETTCPDHPEAPAETGFGLAGGGFGPYTYCTECFRVLSKSKDEGF